MKFLIEVGLGIKAAVAFMFAVVASWLFDYQVRAGMVLSAVSLPNGIILSLGTALGAEKTISAVTNANPAVASSASHGLAAGDIFTLKSGWARANERVFRVGSSPATGSFSIDGLDASNTSLFPAGSGVGSAVPVTTFTQITQVLDLTTSGGDMQFTQYSFLENDFESQLPTQAAAQSLTLSIADDPSLAGYIALKNAGETRAARVLRAVFPNGSVLLYYGYVSFNETPSMTKNEVMACQATFSLLSKPVRYAS